MVGMSDEKDLSWLHNRLYLSLLSQTTKASRAFPSCWSASDVGIKSSSCQIVRRYRVTFLVFCVHHGGRPSAAVTTVGRIRSPKLYTHWWSPNYGVLGGDWDTHCPSHFRVTCWSHQKTAPQDGHHWDISATDDASGALLQVAVLKGTPEYQIWLSNPLLVGTPLLIFTLKIDKVERIESCSLLGF